MFLRVGCGIELPLLKDRALFGFSDALDHTRSKDPSADKEQYPRRTRPENYIESGGALWRRHSGHECEKDLVYSQGHGQGVR